MSIVREPWPPNGSGKVIEDRPQSRVAERTAYVALRCRGSAGQVAIELRPARKPRIAVDPGLFEGDEVRPDVAFLESADLDAILLRDAASHPVDRPAIAKQQHQIDLPLHDQRLQEVGPVAPAAAPVQGAAGIKQPIAAVEIDLVDLRARRAQLLREAPEERPHRALQQQDPLAPQRIRAGFGHGRATVRRRTARRSCCQARLGRPAPSRRARRPAATSGCGLYTRQASGFASRTARTRARLVRSERAPRRSEASDSTCPGTRITRARPGRRQARSPTLYLVMPDATMRSRSAAARASNCGVNCQLCSNCSRSEGRVAS